MQKKSDKAAKPRGARAEKVVSEEDSAERPSVERQKLIDNPNLNQAGNDRGSHDEPATGSQTGSDID